VIAAGGTPSFHYITKLPLDEGFVIGKTLYVSRLSVDSVKEKWAHVLRKNKLKVEDADRALEQWKGQELAIAKREHTWQFLRTLKKHGIKLRDVSKVLEQVRLIKTPQEVKCISEAVKLTQQLLDSIDPFDFTTEQALFNYVVAQTFELGDGPFFTPIVSTDEHTRFPHHFPTHKRIGKTVLIDMGVRVGVYGADITRVWSRDRRVLELYERAQQFVQELVDSVKAGDTISELVRRWEAWNPNKPHALGHGVGVEVHEAPFFTLTNHTKLQAGMVFTLEPAVYTAQFGVRYEDVFVVSKHLKSLLLT
jgi:Xaa-Pro aminopeptidase